MESGLNRGLNGRGVNCDTGMVPQEVLASEGWMSLWLQCLSLEDVVSVQLTERIWYVELNMRCRPVRATGS